MSRPVFGVAFFLHLCVSVFFIVFTMKKQPTKCQLLFTLNKLSRTALSMIYFIFISLHRGYNLLNRCRQTVHGRYRNSPVPHTDRTT